MCSLSRCAEDSERWGASACRPPSGVARELEYRHGAPVAEVFAWLRDHGYVAQALNDRQTLGPIDADSLRLFQDEERLQRRLAGCRHAGYVNNFFFLPSH
jgi:hypothetical protein